MSEMDNEVQWEQTNEVQLLFRESGPVCVCVCVCVCGEWKSKLLLHTLIIPDNIIIRRFSKF